MRLAPSNFAPHGMSAARSCLINISQALKPEDAPRLQPGKQAGARMHHGIDSLHRLCKHIHGVVKHNEPLTCGPEGWQARAAGCAHPTA